MRSPTPERRAPAPFALHHPEARRRLVRLPALRHREGAAGIVHVDDPQHRDLGNAAHAVEGAAGAGVDQPLVAHVAQHLLERDLVLAVQAEGARDLALVRRPIGRGDEVEDLLAGGEAALGGSSGHTPQPRHPGLDPGSTFFSRLLRRQVDAGSSPA